jgi:hypothetical protein
MAQIISWDFCSEIVENKETGRYSPLEPIDNFAFSNRQVRFVFVVYWLGVPGESFSQSFTLMDDAGNILNEVPETEYRLTKLPQNISVARFQTRFPQMGHYSINIKQNGITIAAVPVNVNASSLTNVQ